MQKSEIRSGTRVYRVEKMSGPSGIKSTKLPTDKYFPFPPVPGVVPKFSAQKGLPFLTFHLL